MMSGIAYKTYCFQKELIGSETILLDTRKTLPGLRYEQKYSVVIGGVKIIGWVSMMLR